MKTPEDPRVTDLRRYKKAREQAARKPVRPNSAPQMRQTVLGSNRYALPILVLVVVILLAVWVLPAIL